MDTQHKEQRVGVFVDVQNMYYSAKQLYGYKVNFLQILKAAVAGRRLVRAFCYVIKADVKDEHNFHEALEKIGYEVKSKDLQVFYGGAKKGDWDVGIAMDIMRMVPKLDVVVLVSGDGDFVDLIETVQSMGCRTEVISFAKTTSAKLRSKADGFTEMDKHKERFLIKERKRAPSKTGTAPRTATARKTAAKPSGQIQPSGQMQQTTQQRLLEQLNADQPAGTLGAKPVINAGPVKKSIPLPAATRGPATGKAAQTKQVPVPVRPAAAKPAPSMAETPKPAPSPAPSVPAAGPEAKAASASEETIEKTVEKAQQTSLLRRVFGVKK